MSRIQIICSTFAVFLFLFVGCGEQVAGPDLYLEHSREDLLGGFSSTQEMIGGHATNEPLITTGDFSVRGTDWWVQFQVTPSADSIYTPGEGLAIERSIRREAVEICEVCDEVNAKVVADAILLAGQRTAGNPYRDGRNYSVEVFFVKPRHEALAH